MAGTTDGNDNSLETVLHPVSNWPFEIVSHDSGTV